MLDNLKFVQRAVQQKALDPELRHYRIQGGRITAFNGRMALSAPIDLDLDASPEAVMFYRAIEASEDSVAIHMTPSKRLAVRSGRFKAFIPCLDHTVYDAAPDGDIFEVPDGLVDAFEAIYPFISEDASRPWSMGALSANGMLMATNNVTLVQQWIGHDFPTVNIPRFAVAELIRLKEKPVRVQVSDSSITFHFSGERWFRSQLMSAEWPFEKMDRIMNVDSEPEPLPELLPDAVNKIGPFMGEKSTAVCFVDEGISTHQRVQDDGVHIHVPGLPDGPVFSIHQLRLMMGVVKTIDFSMYPNPCMFFGDNLRGAVIGMVL